MAEERERGVGTGIVLGGIGGATLATIIAALIAARPAAAATPEVKLDYLLECLTALVPVLAEMSERQATLIQLLEKWEVSGRAPWIAKDPEQIYQHDIRAIGTFFTDKMVDWTKGKRFLFKIESTLDVACQVQVIGNFVHDIPMASNVNGIINIAADENHTIGLAWDDWHPFVGLRIVTAAAPTAGMLTIWAVIQE